MTWCAALLFLFLQAAPATPKGSMEGVVVRSGTREPVTNVLVVLQTYHDSGTLIYLPGPNPSAWTDTAGRFSFKDVAPGNHRLAFSANGYVPQEYGQRTFPGKGTPISLAPGQAKRDLIAEMTPAGSVSGIIRDENNRPLNSVPVQLLRTAYHEFDGFKGLQPSAAPAVTNDRGEYRIYFVSPGRYYVNAGTPPGTQFNDPTSPGPNEVVDMYSYLYYPGVADVKFASAIEVRAGESKVAVDMKLSRQQGVRVRGRVIDSTTGLPPANPKVSLTYHEPFNGGAWESRGKVLYKDGIFEFRNVPPGLFTLSATVEEPDPPLAVSPGVRPEPLKRSAVIPVAVETSDVDGIVLNLVRGASLYGSIRVEGRQGLRDALTLDSSGSSGSVSLGPSSNGSRPSIPPFQWLHSPVNPEGMFRIDNVMPGEYVLRGGGKQGFYIKEARFGLTDVLKTPFQFSGREVGNFEIVLSPNVASLEGTVTGLQSTAAGVQVVLVPDQPRFRSELFKTATTDPNGRFSLRNIAPGDYKIYAWESIEPYSWFDADVLKKYEQFARPVRLPESATQTIDARLIPAEAP